MKMRISFILSSFRLSGGVRVIIEYANRLSANGHHVTLIAPSGTIESDMKAETNDSVELRESKILSQDKNSVINLLRLTWALAKETPKSDVVISTHTPTTPATFIASRVLKKGRSVWLYQDYREMFLDRPIIDWLLRNALRWHDCAWVVSEYSKNELLQYVSGNVINIGEGISQMEYFHPIPDSKRTKTAGSPQNILFLGDSRPRKGMPDFLEAVNIVAQQIPDIMLWIVSKEKCPINSKLPYRFFLRPAREKLANLYATCDVFVSASWWESFGLPPLEAMACGAPVVLTDSRGVNEFAISGVNCIMTPPKDPQSLANGILQVLNDPNLSDQLRQNGPITASNFSWDSAVSRFETALQELRLSQQ